MKFAYFEIEKDTADSGISGQELAKLICNSLNGDGPYERGDYGWEWTFKGTNYKALAVLQEYEAGWLVPVKVGFFDRVLKRDKSVMNDLCEGIERVISARVINLKKFESEEEFRASNV